MSDYQDACDPVPPRRELTEAQKVRLKAIQEKRLLQRRFERGQTKDVAICGWRVNPDFEEMGA